MERWEPPGRTQSYSVQPRPAMGLICNLHIFFFSKIESTTQSCFLECQLQKNHADLSSRFLVLLVSCLATTAI